MSDVVKANTIHIRIVLPAKLRGVKSSGHQGRVFVTLPEAPGEEFEISNSTQGVDTSLGIDQVTTAVLRLIATTEIIYE
jgi:hypothetical protein